MFKLVLSVLDWTKPVAIYQRLELLKWASHKFSK